MTARPPSARSARLLSADPGLAELFDAAGDDLAPLLDLLADQLPPVPPSPSLRARLLRSAAPFSAFADGVARLFELSVERVRTLLATLSDPATWETLVPGCELVHVSGGPIGADVGFVRVADGADFPRHLHGGVERNLILAGAMVEADGTRRVVGDRFDLPAGSEHRFRAEGELIFAVVVWGVQFDDELQARLHA